MKIYLALNDIRQFESATGAGAKNLLVSIFYLKEPVTSKLMSTVDSLNWLLDSGGFTYRRNNMEASVEDYAKRINELGVKLAFNLDTNDYQETKANLAYLTDACRGCYIIPIVHPESFHDAARLADMKELIRTHPYIALGGIALNKQREKYLRYLFDLTRTRCGVHGLGVTSLDLLKSYPFASCDSTSWLSSGITGGICSSDLLRGKHRMFSIDEARKQHRANRRTLAPETLGIFIDYHEKRRRGGIAAVKLEQFITALWRKRGVNWDNLMEAF